MKRIATGLLVLALLTSNSKALLGYDQATHGVITERAVLPTVSSVDRVLKEDLGLSGGINQQFFGKTIQRIVGDGARTEDEPFRRVLNHFHNPLQPWNQAGLRVGFQLGQSSVLWQQNTNQDSSSVFVPFPLKTGGGNWSWQDARRHYLNALVRPRKEDRQNEPGRDSAFADTFRALGQVTHLVQDATVPAHVRNDPHLSFRILGVPIPVNPDWYEDWAERNRDKVNKFINLEPVKPPFSIFRPTGDSQAPVPVARLIDNDKFQDGDFSILSDSDLGTAEYTNGNFLSRNRMFGSFTLPRTNSLDFNNPIVKPVGTKLRRYFSKVREGESVEHFVAESMLFRSLRTASAAPPPSGGWMMDDLIQEDYGRLLLPRAVGYSAGLLDYFFRGKLDVDLSFPDPNDPSILELKGTNASPDPLVNGMLALYADEPDGTRNAVDGLNPLTVSRIDPGQQISDPAVPRRFQLNPQLSKDPERFVVVYQGTLGQEVKDTAGNFPGGVIGKVLGGVRAESIFPQGDKRMLRTVPVNGVGIFPLPAAADRLENIQWGNQDNTFVGILSNPGTPRSPDQILAFRINRPLGSGEVPLLDGSGGTQVVSAEALKTVGFPFGLPLGVTVNYSQTFRVQQARLAFDVVDTNVFVQTDPKDPTVGFYELASREVTAPIVQTVLDQTIPFSQSFPIVLDHAHHCSQSCFSFEFDDFPFFIGPIIRPYIWRVREVTLDQQGQLHALVDVILIEPDNRTRTGFLAETDIYGRGGWTVAAGFQVSGLLRGVIDVDNGNVLGVTSSATVSLSSQHAISFTSLKQHRVTTYVGGPSGGTTNETEILGRFASGNPNFTTVETGTARTPTAGLLSEAILGRFRSDLEPLITVPTGIGTREFAFPLVYFVDDVTQTNKVVRVAFTSSFSTGTIIPLAQPQMIRPTAGISPQVLLLFSQRVPGSFVYQEEGIPVRWFPESPANTTLALSYRLPPVDSYSLLYTTSKAALLHFGDFGVPDPQLGPGVFTLVVDFTSQQTQIFPGLLGFQYVLLDPKLLYNLNDTKFHTLDLSLRQTALPRRLADATPFRPPTAAYHLIKLQ